jgi:hypothetical protein
VLQTSDGAVDGRTGNLAWVTTVRAIPSVLLVVAVIFPTARTREPS